MKSLRLDQDLLDAVERTAFRITRCADDAQQVCTEVFEELRTNDQAPFEGRSLLKTWIIAITRNKAIDLRRKRTGRRTVPRSVVDLGAAHEEFYRRYIHEGLPYGAVRAILIDHGLIDDSDSVAQLLGDVLDTIDPRTMHRIQWDRPGAPAACGDGRLLELHDELRRQARDRSERLGREFDEHEERLRRTLEVLADHRRHLPEDERLVLEMRYDRNMTAAEIAASLGLENPRRVYTMIDRSLRTLRRLLTAAGLPAET
jgi:RNA polymerase sigma factor (sigma-70 family)